MAWSSQTRAQQSLLKAMVVASHLDGQLHLLNNLILLHCGVAGPNLHERGHQPQQEQHHLGPAVE